MTPRLYRFTRTGLGVIAAVYAALAVEAVVSGSGWWVAYFVSVAAAAFWGAREFMAAFR